MDGEGGMRIQCLWKVRNYGCGVELITRIYHVAEAAGHFPNLHLEQANQVRAELWTASIGGLIWLILSTLHHCTSTSLITGCLS